MGAAAGPGMKLIVIALADEASDDSSCFPSISHFARKCGMSDRTVQRTIGNLTRLGYIAVEVRFRKDGCAAATSTAS